MARITVRRRILFLFLMLSFLLWGLGGRLAWLQLYKGAELRQRAQVQWTRDVPVEPKRGRIIDRNGKELALSASAPTVVAIPIEVRDPRSTAQALAKILELDPGYIERRLTTKAALVYVARKIDEGKAAQVRELALPGIGLTEESRRFYPSGKLASHIIGFAGVDSQGLDGVELSYDEYLRGHPGQFVYETDARGRTVPGGLKSYVPPRNGYTLQLTIDEVIQHILERELDRAELLHRPQGIMGIILDPMTGEILALANRPTFDPNNYRDYESSSWRNISISNQFEPGSTFKIVTAAAALEEKVMDPEERFNCAGSINVAGETIHDWSLRGHGSITWAQVIAKSCNPGFVTLGLRLGKEKLFKYIFDFGFNRKTGVDLPGEGVGIMFKLKDVGPVELATTAFGQGPAVTPLQQIVGVAAVANGGNVLKPRIAKAVLDENGQVVQEFGTEVLSQPISPETARRLSLLLEGVVQEDGTGRRAIVEGYRVAGKTGTAQKVGPRGGYGGGYVGSFIGFAPANEPRIAMIISIDQPEGSYYGGVIAAPVFRQVAWDVLRYLGVKPQLPPDVAKLETARVPQVSGLPPAQGIRALRDAGFKAEAEGEGSLIVHQVPPGGAEVPLSSPVIVYLGEEVPVREDLVTVPYLLGKTLAEANRALGDSGLRLRAFGSGTAVKQWPESGDRVEAGSTVTVEFGDPEAP